MDRHRVMTNLRALSSVVDMLLDRDKIAVSVPVQGKGSTVDTAPKLYALIDYSESYVQPLILQALSSQLSQLPYELITTITQLPSLSSPVLQIAGYEALDFDHVLQNHSTSLVCAYVIRKALVRKHYLSSTVATWLVKHPDSVLRKHFKPAVHFELDFAEFLDEALVDAWDLNESLVRNEEIEGKPESKEWWILKPGMSDGGNGIRLFSSMDELREIFEEWEFEEPDDEEDDDGQEVTSDEGKSDLPKMRGGAEDVQDGGMTSQLRHFIAQPYIHPPLLLESKVNRKFHVRVYVLAVGALKVYVYKEMLALFAAREYYTPGQTDVTGEIDLARHLTNTCFQDESTRSSSVCRFWELENDKASGTDWHSRVWKQICDVTGEVFEAASREQMVHFQTLPNAFEIFGVDFLIDADFNAWLLELNAYPDFKQTGDDLQNVVVGGLFEEVVSVAVRPFFARQNRGAGNQSDRMMLVRDIELGRF